jgi:hypothetical protein
MTAYAVTYRATGPRGSRVRTMALEASDDASARKAALWRLALPTLTAARTELLAVAAVAQDRGDMLR